MEGGARANRRLAHYPQSVRKQGKEAIPQAEARAISTVMPGIMQEHPRLSLLV
jgi:hypothetical protein